MAGKLGRAKKGLGGAAALAVAAGRRSAEVDIKVEEDNTRRENAARLLSIDMIKDRPSEDTRPVDPEHVSALVESIRLVGLIQPIYLDREFRLIAGAHRLSAFKLLQREDAQKWGKIPVVVDPELDAVTQPELALIKEIAENEKRSNLTPAQVQAAAERLISADPSFTRRAGRLKQGERALTPFLANTFGVSTRYVRSLLNSIDEGASPPPEESQKDHSREQKTRPIDPIRYRQKLYRKMIKQARAWHEDPVLSEDKKVMTQLERLLKSLEPYQ